MSFDPEKREDELLARLEPLLKEAEEKQTVSKEQVTKERTMLQAACTDYINSRNDFMAQMLEGMSSNNGDQENPYKNAISNLGPVVSRTFSERIKNVGTPSPQADLFCMRTEIEEATFMKALEQTVIAASKRDYLYKYEGIIKKQIEDLEKRWAEVKKAHESYDATEKQIADELTKVITEAAQEAAAKTATKGEAAVRIIDMAIDPVAAIAGKLVELGEAASTAQGVLKQAIASWRAKNDFFSSRMKQFQDAYKSEVGTTLVLFKDFREETKKFIDDFGYDKAQKESDAGERALSDFVSACATDGQKSDAAVFADEGKKALKAKLDIAKNIWDDFVKKNEKKFFGPVGPDISEALLSLSAWKDKKSAMLYPNLHSLLKDWRDESRSHQFIEIASKGNELKLLVQPLVDELVELRTAWEKTMETVYELEKLDEQRNRDAQGLS